MVPRTMPLRTPRMLLAACACVCPALGQNALGDGRGLERRLELSAPTQRQDPALRNRAELEFRDALISGNAPGGLSFRGDTAFSGTRDFEGELGSNDLFAFRRDSLYSGLSGMGIRGTEAIQYQFALTTGGNAPSQLIGVPVYARSGSASISGDIGPSPDAELDAAWAGDSSMLGTMRSASAFLVNRVYQPAVINVSQNLAGEPVGMTASGLGGIRSVPLAQRVDSHVSLATTGSDALERRLAELAGAQDAPASAPIPEWRQRLDELEAELLTVESEARPTVALPGTLPAQIPTDLETGAPMGLEGLSEPMIDLIRGSRFRLESVVVDPGSPGDVFPVHCRAAEAFMAEGRYFDAEERYTMALSAKSGDASVALARVNAQLGAGLFRSAGINLRDTLAGSPESCAIRFGPGVLPRPERIAELKETLRGLIERGGSGGSPLLLAYLGYQTDDAPAAREGITLLEASSARADRALAQLLRAAWLDETGGDGG
ncbi:MAG: hypothetical protein IT439_02355 [Phycisphaerales bacterium]|nr:hypothetical protein [Phycisphaerales bacterium]